MFTGDPDPTLLIFGNICCSTSARNGDRVGRRESFRGCALDGAKDNCPGDYLGDTVRISGITSLAFAIAGMLSLGSTWAQERQALTDAQIRTLIIQESLRSYPGNCPCPFNADRAGRSCGGRSAWSRAGGARPICFADEISDEQIRRYRESR
jgi:hypothetical protein